VVWFALSEDRPLFAFAGMWTTFNGDRGTRSKPVPGPHQVYGFLTTSPNAVVEPIHPKAMPVILTTDGERDVWMRARGMKRRGCNDLCRTMPSGSCCAGPTRRIARRSGPKRLVLLWGTYGGVDPACPVRVDATNAIYAD
jgi:putative SOS response-associated peptidase YedK